MRNISTLFSIGLVFSCLETAMAQGSFDSNSVSNFTRSPIPNSFSPIDSVFSPDRSQVGPSYNLDGFGQRLHDYNLNRPTLPDTGPIGGPNSSPVLSPSFRSYVPNSVVTPDIGDMQPTMPDIEHTFPTIPDIQHNFPKTPDIKPHLPTIPDYATGVPVLPKLPSQNTGLNNRPNNDLLPGLEDRYQLGYSPRASQRRREQVINPPPPSLRASLPSYQTQKAIEQLQPASVPEEIFFENDLSIANGFVSVVPQEEQTKYSMLILFRPEATAEEIRGVIEEKDFDVIRSFPEIGIVQIHSSFENFPKPNSENPTKLERWKWISSIARELMNDTRIRSAAPDILLYDQGPDIVIPNSVFVSTKDKATEILDWGVRDIQADRVWELPGARDGVLFGVVDTGFSRHEDLTFFGYPKEIGVADHGTHVAGIACASHRNKVGVRGVLPKCFVRALVAEKEVENRGSTPLKRYMTSFTEVIDQLSKFVTKNDDVQTFNVSLGFNLQRNFGINPEAFENSDIRDDIAMLGAMVKPILEKAANEDKVIFSAAGNDSNGLAKPISAEFGSPFNSAAYDMRKNDGIANGVVVEAHDKMGRRGGFSNIGGHISCPGVDIVSTVAFDENRVRSEHAYGRLSGTSSATPYCAGGFQLFRLVRPSYSAVEAISCITQTETKSSSGTPMLRLLAALENCPLR
ncbi:S8 family serine peptidase [Thalassospira sp.]|uniref:S8 family peptidase n=1 Tax=Thalassospira sp. TaxID=1912094 RepID=UPI0032EAC668